jgi:hypothetical protein
MILGNISRPSFHGLKLGGDSSFYGFNLKKESNVMDLDMFGYASAAEAEIKISLHSVWLTLTTFFLRGSPSKLSLNCCL